MLLKPADGTANAVANICGYSLHGDAQFEVENAQGTLSSTWQFRSNTPTVTVTGATYTDSSGDSHRAPRHRAHHSPARGTGTLTDWVGEFNQYWACLPPEYGQAHADPDGGGRHRDLNDEDPPGSGNGEHLHRHAGAGESATRCGGTSSRDRSGKHLPRGLHLEAGAEQELVHAGEPVAVHRGAEHRDGRDVRSEGDEAVGGAGRQRGREAGQSSFFPSR